MTPLSETRPRKTGCLLLFRPENQLESLAQFCEDDKEAIKTLNYLINRGYSYIFKVNFETEKTKTNNSQIPDGEF